ncbi:hypothetical protein OXX80_010182 [Metschnikowia pulcherrima]
MSGLGIVLEESGRSPDLRNGDAEVSTPSMAEQAEVSETKYSADETLLPPLPETEDGELIQPPRPGLGVLSSASSVGHVLSPSASSTGLLQSTNTTPHSEQGGENIFVVPESYALDSSALSIDTPPIAFPSVESQSSSLSLQNAPSLGPAPVQASNTSPLRRLKSLKNGIRKLSFSRMGSFTSMPSPQDSAQGRPQYSPTSTESCPNDTSSSSSGCDSVKSTFSSSAVPSSAYTSHGHSHAFSSTASTPQGPTHTHTSSSGSAGSATKSRRRTISLSNSASTPTPSLPSPIVTLSEDLSSTKKNLDSIEQNFFENWTTPAPDSMSQASASQVTTDDADIDQSDKLAILNTPDDLVEYSNYLSQHKKSVELAYDVSRNRLINSGWCSGHDIENLNLQRDSSLSQIDSKLLQIEEKLNSEFNISYLNNKHMQQMSPRQKCAARVALSPSLKDLENKCLYFSAEHGNMCQ